MTDMPNTPNPSWPAVRVRALETEILKRHSSVVRELRIVPEGNQVVLYGRAASFYGKQMAQEDVIRRGNLSVRANRMQVSESQETTGMTPA